MMENHKLINKLFDRDTSEEEKAHVMQVIQKDNVLMDEYKYQLEANTALNNMPVSIPSRDFVSSVMEGVSKAKFHVPARIRMQGVFLIIGVLICLFFIAIMIDSVESLGILDSFNDINLLDVSVDLSVLSGFFNARYLLQGILLSTFVILMMVFDAVVLRPWFQGRK